MQFNYQLTDPVHGYNSIEDPKVLSFPIFTGHFTIVNYKSEQIAKLFEWPQIRAISGN